MTTIIARSAESVHWYRQDGAPQYTVKAKNGTDRSTTLKDARTMNLVPSVTTILKISAKPGLEAWKLEQMLLAALTLPKRAEETEKEFINRVVADSKETGKQAAERGTRIHESIEKWFTGNQKVEHREISKAFAETISSHFKTPEDQPWQVERAFASGLGYGGKIDLYCEPDMVAQTGIVIDAKTKEFGPDDSIAAYDEHLMQLAAYRYGLGLNHARCANVFASVTYPGLIKVVEWPEEDLKRGWEMFQCLLKFWKLKHNFGS
ncbi:hypothetical protein UFOVP239_47 [uncultured Caudovirales phage]|uniref:PD-(D/E)XK endonuclease-like domain-containing protein n=1 Tax=uncultured Caudovirales phage TaxID=2100421 RepID=A0A6J7WTQ9_9CAUD|nr:hypothetical protein UFOVP239_47 [uncultured Caudovirales phage]